MQVAGRFSVLRRFAMSGSALICVCIAILGSTSSVLGDITLAFDIRYLGRDRKTRCFAFFLSYQLAPIRSRSHLSHPPDFRRSLQSWIMARESWLMEDSQKQTSPSFHSPRNHGECGVATSVCIVYCIRRKVTYPSGPSHAGEEDTGSRLPAWWRPSREESTGPARPPLQRII